MKKKIFINYSLIIFLIFSFIYGVFSLENSPGEAEIDSTQVLNNFDLFKTHNLTNFPWEKYKSSSSPIYYFVLDIFLETKKNLSNLNIFLSLVTLFFFFQIIKKESKYIFKKSEIYNLSLDRTFNCFCENKLNKYSIFDQINYEVKYSKNSVVISYYKIKNFKLVKKMNIPKLYRYTFSDKFLSFYLD